MPLDFDKTQGNIVVVRASGKLTDADYKSFVPRMEKLFEQWGRLRMLFMMDDFEGWDFKSAWNELKFELAHTKDMKKVAVVGEKRWEKWATNLTRLFSGAEIRYYDRTDAKDALEWIEAGW